LPHVEKKFSVIIEYFFMIVKWIWSYCYGYW